MYEVSFFLSVMWKHVEKSSLKREPELHDSQWMTRTRTVKVLWENVFAHVTNIDQGREESVWIERMKTLL